MNLDYKVLKNGYMSVSASTLLKVIQNNNMPILDLLAREVIQNSLDAKLQNVNNVEINVNIGKFDSFQLNSRINPIGPKIYEKYNCDKINSFISFGDKNTTGLTGPITENEAENNDYGKFLNLVFHIGKAQSAAGSGGSWGYGKTIYYRVGIGLVLFYTRIKENNEYKSRFVIAFVEDEKDTIIPFADEKEKNKTGIMWFGKKNNDELYPVTNEEEIEEFLRIFNIPKYTDNETGTTIIIPYIDEEKLLKNTYYTNNGEIFSKPEWCDSVEKYIKVAIQRWYAPRLMNANYMDNPYLKLIINNKIFNKQEDFLPVFKTIQELYNFSNGNSDIKAYKEEIVLRDSFEIGGKAGKIIYTKLTKEELGIPIETSPYVQIANTEDVDLHMPNPPIITFCRKPGMLLKYDIKEAWSNHIENNNTDEYIIGVFVANSYIKLKKKDNRDITLEEYLRESEKADHANWFDLSDYNIIKKIQKQIQTKINAKFATKIPNNIKVINTDLNKKLTALFLPKVGFGKRPNAKKNKIKTQKDNETIHIPKYRSSFSFISNTLKLNNFKNTISKDFMISVNKNDLNLSYEFEIVGEEKNISGKEWEEKVDKRKFPIEIIRIEILYKVINKDIEYIKNGTINNIANEFKDDQITLSKKYTPNGKWIGWNININKESKVSLLRGRLTYKYLDNKYSCTVSSVKGDRQ